MRRTIALLIAAAATVSLAACSSSSGSSASSSPAAKDDIKGTITVLAASSLQGTYTTLSKDFKKLHPDLNVVFNFDSSGALAIQANNLAPADVFASADTASMKTVSDAGNTTGKQVTFGGNVLEIAVPAANPAKITQLSDLKSPNVKVAICVATAPCGKATLKVEQAVGFNFNVVTQQPDVKSVLTQVTLGEVDAGMVYHSDVLSAGAKVKGISFPEAADAPVTYVAASLKQTANPKAAAAWVQYMLSANAQKVFAAAGFLKP